MIVVQHIKKEGYLISMEGRPEVWRLWNGRLIRSLPVAMEAARKFREKLASPDTPITLKMGK